MAETNTEPQYIVRQDLEQLADQMYTKLSSDINVMFESIKGKQSATTSNLDSPIQYDKDNDVIMKNTYHNNPPQVPEPGFFSGNTAETELFCDLCEATFKTYPNKDWPEDAKINFVKTRLRDSARNWFLTKYKDGAYPESLDVLLRGLREAFNNVGSIKLAKIKLVALKQNYGNINKYIDDFRNITLKLNLLDDALALFFYNGLHSKYQEEIQKLDAFPETLEEIITKCILFENTLKTTNKVKESTNSSKSKNTRKHYNNNNYKYKNKNKYNNYKNNYQQRNNNYYNKNTNNNNNENIVKAQKINSKN